MLKLLQVVNPETESIISKLHYRVTSIIFLVCCILVTCVEYIGNGLNIACSQGGHPDMWPIPQHIMNTYCFIMGTFTLPRTFAGEANKVKFFNEESVNNPFYNILLIFCVIK